MTGDESAPRHHRRQPPVATNDFRAAVIDL